MSSHKQRSKSINKTGRNGLSPKAKEMARTRAEIRRVSLPWEVENLKKSCKDKMIVILFWAIWYPESELMKVQM